RSARPRSHVGPGPRGGRRADGGRRARHRRACRRSFALDSRRGSAGRAARRPLGQDGLRSARLRRVSQGGDVTTTNAESPPRDAALGRVVATERKPNTPHEFHFWTALDSPVGIGTIVRVEGEHPVNGQIPTIYGIVVEGFSYTDLQTPLHDLLGHDGTPEGASMSATQRTEIRLYTAAVLRQVPEEPLQPVPMGQVFLADDNDVA